MYASLKSTEHYMLMLLVIVFYPAINSYSQTEILIQAESADTIKTGTVDNNDQGFTGTGFVNLDNKQGTYVVWMINLPSSGTYNMTVRYANGSTDRTMNIYVNHVLKKSNFNFTSTGSWTTWQTATFQLDFSKGINHLKFEGSNPNSGPSLDYIKISSNDAPPVNQPDWSVEMANMIISTRSTSMDWDYTVGLLLEGVLRVYKRTHDSRYLNFIKTWAQHNISADGIIDNNLNSLDNMMPGFTILHLYRETGIETFKLAADRIKERLKNTYPRTPDGCFWHMTNLEGELWLDGLYMGMPFLATYGQRIGDQTYAYSEAIKQFKLHINYLKDNNTGLLLHAYDYDGSAPWATSSKRSPWAWGRAIGWVMMGLSEILDIIPGDFPQRNDIVEQYKSVLKALARYQDPATGLWYQVVDHQKDAGNWLETSCSMMFVYSMARAIEKGFLDDSYKKYVTLGYNGILTKINQDANKMVYLKDICGGTSVSSDIQYYFKRPRNTNDNHGLGTFMIMNELVKYNNLPWLGGSTVPQLSVAPSSVTLASSSGAKSTFNVSSNTDWKVTKNADWFSLSSSSGTGNGSITAETTSANPMAVTRTAEITFTAGNLSFIVEVIQSGAAPTLSVIQNNENIAASSGAQRTIYITSNTLWSASENADWFSLSSSSGTGNGTITVTTSSANTSANPRSANVTLSATGVNPLIVTIHQSGAGDPILSIEPYSITVEASANAKATFKITSNRGYYISTRADWIKLSSTFGSGNESITVETTSANPLTTSRMAIIDFNSGIIYSAALVYQSGSAPILSVKPLTITVESKAKAQATFNITSNTTWNVTKDKDSGWLNLLSSSGTGDGSITAETTSANPMAIRRTAEITFKADNVSFIVEVIQAEAAPTLSVTPSIINVASSSGSTGTIDINSNASWRVTKDADWINLSSSFGDGDEKIMVTTLSSNNSSNPRSANVTISVTGLNPVIVKVTQAGTIPTSVYEITGSVIVLYPNPVSGILTIDYKDEKVSYLKIINTDGSVIRAEKAIAPVQQIDFSGYRKGLYILEFVRSGGEIVRLKVVNY